MNVFPFIGSINPAISGTIKSRAGKNLDVSKLMSWVRIASAVEGKGHKGLILQSVYKNDFKTFYGSWKEPQSGAVGLSFSGAPVYSDNERSLRPSPIVESLNIQNGNQGLSRKATFSIKCHTLGQAEKLTQHFLEPGYTVLIEYGWNTNDSINKLIDLKGKGACGFLEMNEFVTANKKRIGSRGTYDGFMGYITGGGMSYGDDETYIIDVELTTLGEIPTYLQIHKTAVKLDDDKKILTGKTYDVPEIEADAGNDDSIGKALWKQFYNRLPSDKRTNRVKAIGDEPDSNGNKFSSEWNFVNIDEVVRNTLMEEVSKATVRGEDFNLPDGVNLITDQSFVRLELAFRILNEFSVNVKSKNTCGSSRSYDFRIDINNTIIRAHKYMFSTDITKLYIPNTKLPTFGLEELLLAKEEIELGELIDYNNIKTTDGNPWKNAPVQGNGGYAVPSVRDTIPSDFGTNIDDVTYTTTTKYNWGYLKNLYINVDFFVEVLNRSNYVAKDCYYELLNGISSAANSYWQFEIVEAPNNNNSPNETQDPNQTLHLTVRDMNFFGTVSKSEFNNTAKYPVFDAVGTNTPFLNFNVNMDIPAIMRNSILGKTVAIESQLEGQEAEIDTFFNGGPDPVRELLNSFTQATDDINTEAPADESEDTRSEDEIRKYNLELFAKKGTVVPLIRNRSEVPGKWEFWKSNPKLSLKDFVIGAYTDTTILKNVEMIWKGQQLQNSKDEKLNPQILGVEVSFDIHGVSGLKVGDMFKLNKLPKGYDKPFQIMETSHTLSNGQWITTVRAKVRNI